MTYLTVFILTVLRAPNKSVISAKLPTQSLIEHIEPFHLKQTDVLFKLDLSYFITNVYSSDCPTKLIDMLFDTRVIRCYFVFDRLNTTSWNGFDRLLKFSFCFRCDLNLKSLKSEVIFMKLWFGTSISSLCCWGWTNLKRIWDDATTT